MSDPREPSAEWRFRAGRYVRQPGGYRAFIT